MKKERPPDDDKKDDDYVFESSSERLQRSTIGRFARFLKFLNDLLR